MKHCQNTSVSYKIENKNRERDCFSQIIFSAQKRRITTN